MYETIKKYPHVVTFADEATAATGVTPTHPLIRGGTDGTFLADKGIPCPNIFAGGENFHGITEFVPIPSMEKVVETLHNLVGKFTQ